MKSIVRVVFFILLLSFQPAFAGGEVNQSSSTVAVVQLQSSDAGNYDLMANYAIEAKKNGATLIIFPESSAFGWLNPKVFFEASAIPGDISSNFSSIAKTADIWVATGLAEQGPPSSCIPSFHHAYNSGILINPQGKIVLHHRKYQVLSNAFDPNVCHDTFCTDGCSYTQGDLSDITTVETPFGSTSIIVCADAYIYDTSVLDKLKTLAPDFVIIPWGIMAGAESDCGKSGYNATTFASKAAKYLGTAYVVGANAIGTRTYGRFLPSEYCGYSGYADPSGESHQAKDPTATLIYFDIPMSAKSK